MWRLCDFIGFEWYFVYYREYSEEFGNYILIFLNMFFYMYFFEIVNYCMRNFYFVLIWF